MKFLADINIPQSPSESLPSLEFLQRIAQVMGYKLTVHLSK